MLIKEYSIKTSNYIKNGYSFRLNKFKNDTLAMYVDALPQDATPEGLSNAIMSSLSNASSNDRPTAVFVKTDLNHKLWGELDSKGLLTKLPSKADFLIADQKDLHYAFDAIGMNPSEAKLPQGITADSIRSEMESFKSGAPNPSDALSFISTKTADGYVLKAYFGNAEAMEATIVRDRAGHPNYIMIESLHKALKNTKIVPTILNAILEKTKKLSVAKYAYTESLKGKLGSGYEEDADFIVFSA